MSKSAVVVLQMGQEQQQEGRYQHLLVLPLIVLEVVVYWTRGSNPVMVRLLVGAYCSCLEPQLEHHLVPPRATAEAAALSTATMTTWRCRRRRHP